MRNKWLWVSIAGVLAAIVWKRTRKDPGTLMRVTYEAPAQAAKTASAATGIPQSSALVVSSPLKAEAPITTPPYVMETPVSTRMDVIHPAPSTGEPVGSPAVASEPEAEPATASTAPPAAPMKISPEIVMQMTGESGDTVLYVNITFAYPLSSSDASLLASLVMTNTKRFVGKSDTVSPVGVTVENIKRLVQIPFVKYVS